MRFPLANTPIQDFPPRVNLMMFNNNRNVSVMWSKNGEIHGGHHYLHDNISRRIGRIILREKENGSYGATKCRQAMKEKLEGEKRNTGFGT